MRKVRVPATQPLSAPRSCPKSDSSWAGIVVEPWIVGVGWEPLVVNLSAVDDVNGRINDVITGCFLLSHSFLIRSVLFAAAISSKQQVQTYWARSLSENSRQWWIFHGLPQRIPVQCLMQSAVADTLVVGFIWNDFFCSVFKSFKKIWGLRLPPNPWILSRSCSHSFPAHACTCQMAKAINSHCF